MSLIRVDKSTTEKVYIFRLTLEPPTIKAQNSHQRHCHQRQWIICHIPVVVFANDCHKLLTYLTDFECTCFNLFKKCEMRTLERFRDLKLKQSVGYLEMVDPIEKATVNQIDVKKIFIVLVDMTGSNCGDPLQERNCYQLFFHPEEAVRSEALLSAKDKSKEKKKKNRRRNIIDVGKRVKPKDEEERSHRNILDSLEKTWNFQHGNPFTSVNQIFLALLIIELVREKENRQLKRGNSKRSLDGNNLNPFRQYQVLRYRGPAAVTPSRLFSTIQILRRKFNIFQFIFVFVLLMFDKEATKNFTPSFEKSLSPTCCKFNREKILFNGFVYCDAFRAL
ncbi:hypothetical protein WN51_11051 [Melipona quadrifasciata]|uniref:Uncharacterized protein n=1 Tax=Melipona quadrifasciata TaxID=166423 RepID=A0A0M9A579_9HYME|nr:hypothetical protein WN51_11051 [Melipona quadrifasciata]